MSEKFGSHIPFAPDESQMVEDMVAAYMAEQCGWQNQVRYHAHTDCWINGTQAALDVMREANHG